MNAAVSTTPGIALLCDTNGSILDVLADPLGLAGFFPRGRAFNSCLDPGSGDKSLRFLQQVRAGQAAFNWELQIAAGSRLIHMFSFSGCVIEGRLLIIGSASSQELLSVLDEMTRIHNEQITTARFGLKESSLKEMAADLSQHDLYNQLTSLNSELANAHRELVKQNVELERLNKLKTQFLGMAAHDLRNPIGIILSFSGFLREDAGAVLNAEQLDFLSTIESSSEFMLCLIDDFLDVSAIESGNLRLDRRPSDPRAVLERTVGLNSVLAQKKHIKVAIRIDGVLPVLSIDRGKIEQVLNNLISNAVKFSQPGTEVTVSAAGEGAGVRIAVRDQGPGIPEGERSKLFKPFGKTSVRGTAGESSTGLGLAIARNIVEGHGGVIWVESEVGAGSVFQFTLPA